MTRSLANELQETHHMFLASLKTKFQRLHQTRDLLLPGLLSGQVKFTSINSKNTDL